VKIAHLLAQYLYDRKRLTLAGIGHFELEADIQPEQPKGKHTKPAELTGVNFTNDPQAAEDPDLISYISAQSGKIKALSSADLESHLELGRQFVNIGKPFLLEGIGYLSKGPGSGFTFTPGSVLTERADPLSGPHAFREERMEEETADYRGLLYNKKEKKSIPRPLAIVLILAGLGMAVWGGYLIYKKTAGTGADSPAEPVKESPATRQTPPAPTTLPADTTRAVPDSTKQTLPTEVAGQGNGQTGNYKFILEESSRERALVRFDRLKRFGWNVRMETKDSSLFTLYLVLPVNPADTTRVLDSLSRLNGKPVRLSN
jgi:hypothetical protein